MQRLVLAVLVLLTFPCIVFSTPVPDTGQTKCYNATEEMIPCPQPGEDFYGQDAQYITNPHSYTKLDANGNDLPDEAVWPWAMVRDNVTGLVWEVKDSQDDIKNYRNPHDADNTYYWSDSQGDGTGTEDCISLINAVEFGGYADWRLPTIKELSSLVDSSAPSPGPVINADYFPETKSSNYWSSTDSVVSENETWCVNFDNGVIYDWAVARTFSVMAVRSGSSGSYFDNGDGTISDTDTGLMWQQDTASGFWREALSYCDDLTLADYNDWRLPNRNELQRLVDYGRDRPSIDITYFPSTASEFYWTSTTKAGYPGEAWCLSFLYGPVSSSVKSSAYNYLRCVRDGALIDSDADGISEDGDKGGTAGDNPCTGGEILNCDDNCPRDQNSMQEDSYPPGGNGCGDACECEGNFDDDLDVDGSDASTFKADFGRSVLKNPCSNALPCNGDFECDTDVDGTNATQFKRDFGRSKIVNPCPVCPTDPWCVYP